MQYTYYYDIEENYFVEIESGINNGTQLNDEGWGGSVDRTKEVEVLDDIIFGENEFRSDYPDDSPNSIRYIKEVSKFNRDKPKLLELHRQQSYDNYVTGGGTNITDSHYRNEHNKMTEYAKYCYKIIEVNRNLK